MNGFNSFCHYLIFVLHDERPSIVLREVVNISIKS